MKTEELSAETDVSTSNVQDTRSLFLARRCYRFTVGKTSLLRACFLSMLSIKCACTSYSPQNEYIFPNWLSTCPSSRCLLKKGCSYSSWQDRARVGWVECKFDALFSLSCYFPLIIDKAYSSILSAYARRKTCNNLFEERYHRSSS